MDVCGYWGVIKDCFVVVIICCFEFVFLWLYGYV